MDGIVITGRGVVSPVASGVDPFFDGLLGLQGGISDEGIAPCDFDPETVMTPKEARRTDRFAQLAIAAADQAADEAGLVGGGDPRRGGGIVGTRGGGVAPPPRGGAPPAGGGGPPGSPPVVAGVVAQPAGGPIA